ncbi:hypothetical protein JCM18909_1169 [Cutibacterium acnes JCM 18909]|nr:hypothetical protein JCM18909_1169 [Cutibacterium acnes JCM 18909]
MILLRDDFIGLIMSDKPHNKKMATMSQISTIRYGIDADVIFLKLGTDILSGMKILKTEPQGLWLATC